MGDLDFQLFLGLTLLIFCIIFVLFLYYFCIICHKILSATWKICITLLSCTVSFVSACSTTNSHLHWIPLFWTACCFCMSFRNASLISKQSCSFFLSQSIACHPISMYNFWALNAGNCPDFIGQCCFSSLITRWWNT